MAGGKLRGSGRGKIWTGSHEGELGPPSSGLLRVVILGEVPGEDLDRIFIGFPGVSFQGHGLQ